MNNNSWWNCFYRWLRNRYSNFLSPDYSENEARYSSTWKNSWSCWKMLTLIISGIYKKYRCWSDPYVSCCQPAGPFPSQRVIDIFPSHQIMWPVSSSWSLCVDCSLLQVPQIWPNPQLATNPNSHGDVLCSLLISWQQHTITIFKNGNLDYVNKIDLRWPNLMTTSFQVTPTVPNLRSSMPKCLRVKWWSHSTWKIRSCLGTPKFSIIGNWNIIKYSSGNS